MSYTISVDTGGTFTDAIIATASGALTIGKSLTTHERIFSGIYKAIQAAADDLGIAFNDLMTDTDMLIYGTTRATNAIVTKNTAKTAFITTQGFADILMLKEGGKFNAHDFAHDYPSPYIPHRHTFEIRERINSEGGVSVAFDEQQARTVLQRLKDNHYEAVAVCMLWSITNPEHELKMASLLDELLPGVPYTLSHQLIPVVREYRRASATAIDASLKPLMQKHLSELERDLRSAGFNGELLISTTAGGCNYVEALIDAPIYTVGSGPAMAPIAGLTFSRLEQQGEDVIICDTGGTTFDVGLVRDGALTYTRDTWLGPQYTGDLLGISAVDMRSIGAGGGSIAWIDDGGLMRVGPQSAGSSPGPACYGQGGTEPTVSDAAAVLGYFDPAFFLGGRMTLDVEAARTAIHGIALRLGLTTEQTAYRILSLASEFMMRAIADITINEGVNPQESTIVAGGGAAGLNIMMIAQELGCKRVILPKVASALSASGMQYADIVAEKSASLVTLSSKFNYQAVNRLLLEITEQLHEFRLGLGERGQDYQIQYFAEARYLSQVWELETPLATNTFSTPDDLDQLVESFHQTHERVFAVRDEGSAVEVVNWKARLIAHMNHRANEIHAQISATPGRPSGSRPCFFGTAEPMETAIYTPEALTPGIRITGPAIVEEPTTTLVIFPGMSAEISTLGNYLLHT